MIIFFGKRRVNSTTARTRKRKKLGWTSYVTLWLDESLVEVSRKLAVGIHELGPHSCGNSRVVSVDRVCGNTPELFSVLFAES